MLPIPTPDRLIDPRLHNPRRGPSTDKRSLLEQLAEGIFFLGFAGLLIASAIICGGLAGGLSEWLMLPGGAFGIWAMATICRRAKPLAGLLEAILYGGLVGSLRSNGEDPTTFSPSWIAGGIVAILFLWASYSALKPKD
jgi:hypothetical protein